MVMILQTKSRRADVFKAHHGLKHNNNQIKMETQTMKKKKSIDVEMRMCVYHDFIIHAHNRK